MGKGILVSVSNNLVIDQRVDKVCTSLQQNGHRLFVVGSTVGGKPRLSRSYPTARLPLRWKKSFLFFVEFNFRLFFFLLKKGRSFEVFWANDLDTLLPNYVVAQLYRKKLVCDSHEIYSQLPSLQGKRFRKWIWGNLEAFLLPRCEYVYTVSEGYAHWFRERYGIETIVLRNVPRKADYLNIRNCETKLQKPLDKRLIIYQGALNVSRGLRPLLHAARLLDPKAYVFWIIGTGPEEENLIKQAKELDVWERNVFFLGRITPKELKRITPLADLGLSIEEDGGLSYRYALPNKLFDYLHAGVAVLGSYLPEIRNCIETHALGRCIENHKPEHLAEKIVEMLALPADFFDEGICKAQEQFCWEKEAVVLQDWE